jgi:hypothetical protein
MKTTQAEFRFPVLGFTPDREIWGFRDLDALTRCGPRTLKDDMQAGMELIDADGRHWLVRSVRRTGRAGSLLSLLLAFGYAQSRIEQELEPLAPVTLEDARARACAAVEAFPSDYCQDDELDTVLAPLLAQVKATATIADIYQVLQPDTFQGY